MFKIQRTDNAHVNPQDYHFKTVDTAETRREAFRKLYDLIGSESENNPPMSWAHNYRAIDESGRVIRETETEHWDRVLNAVKSTQQVADLYGVSRQSINTRAARLRQQRGSFGREVGAGTWIFTPDEVEDLRPGAPGRPRSQGND